MSDAACVQCHRYYTVYAHHTEWWRGTCCSIECARAHYQTAKSGGRITEHRPDVEGVLRDVRHRSAVFTGPEA